jgi:hypothetical protein
MATDITGRHAALAVTLESSHRRQAAGFKGAA